MTKQETTKEQEVTHLRADIEDILVGHGAAVLRLEGEIDLATVDHFRQVLDDLVENHPSDVIIDATGITFMDSNGLHVLVEGKRVIHERGSNIVLISSPSVRRVLELVFPGRLFAARVNTMEEALAILSETE